MNVSTPRVIPSASPRNSENDISVTISGGIRSRVISKPFIPPSSVATAITRTAATPTGIPASRQSFPSSTADSAISEPTDKSIPPVTITGVIASASSPTSTPSRCVSNRLATVKKLLPSAEKISSSTISSPSRTHCCGDAMATNDQPKSPGGEPGTAVCCDVDTDGGGWVGAGMVSWPSGTIRRRRPPAG